MRRKRTLVHVVPTSLQLQTLSAFQHGSQLPREFNQIKIEITLDTLRYVVQLTWTSHSRPRRSHCALYQYVLRLQRPRLEKARGAFIRDAGDQSDDEQRACGATFSYISTPNPPNPWLTWQDSCSLTYLHYSTPMYSIMTNCWAHELISSSTGFTWTSFSAMVRSPRHSAVLHCTAVGAEKSKNRPQQTHAWANADLRRALLGRRLPPCLPCPVNWYVFLETISLLNVKTPPFLWSTVPYCIRALPKWQKFMDILSIFCMNFAQFRDKKFAKMIRA